MMTNERQGGLTPQLAVNLHPYGAEPGLPRGCAVRMWLLGAVLALAAIAGCAHRQLSATVRQQIGAQIEAQQGELAACYQQALDRNPKIAGRMTLSFVIAAKSGELRHLDISDREVEDSQLRSCVLTAIRRIKLQSGADKPVQVSYPLAFSTGTIAQGEATSAAR